ncbi:MAG: glycosyltransferase [Candidatus Omnitrophica bacterium]|nr:glycosyltransferase [Candidatus Omnitrophota bacterium]
MADTNSNKKPEIHIIANAASLDKKSAALSGGDRIYIELARCWARSGLTINIYLWEEGLKMCRDVYKLKGVKFHLWPAKVIEKLPFVIGYFYRILSGVVNALKLKVKDGEIVYSASDFWQDSIPAIILKLKNKNIKWIAGFFLFAPKFWSKETPYKGWRFLIGFGYWIMQLPIYLLVKNFADIVFVTSEPDVKKFVTKRRPSEKVVVIRGGVDIKPSLDYLNSGKIISFENRIYDACFVGRFHSQKGILELIDIWKIVSSEISEARLAMIGIGDLEKEAQKKIAELNLEKNIDLLGFKDGQEKYVIFKQSKIIVHPAVYDSGGMAAAEAMAWGLPGVSFDLEALKTYYPKGMLKTRCFDKHEFAENIIKLITNMEIYSELKDQAIELIHEKWGWEKRAEEICLLAGIK